MFVFISETAVLIGGCHDSGDHTEASVESRPGLPVPEKVDSEETLEQKKLSQQTASLLSRGEFERIGQDGGRSARGKADFFERDSNTAQLLRRRYPNSLPLMSRVARLSCNAADWENARKIFAKVGGRVDSKEWGKVKTFIIFGMRIREALEVNKLG